MNTDKEYLEKSVINLTIENAKLKIKLEQSETAQSRNWRWYSEEKEKADNLQAELDKIYNTDTISVVLEPKESSHNE